MAPPASRHWKKRRRVTDSGVDWPYCPSSSSHTASIVCHSPSNRTYLRAVPSRAPNMKSTCWSSVSACTLSIACTCAFHSPNFTVPSPPLNLGTHSAHINQGNAKPVPQIAFSCPPRSVCSPHHPPESGSFAP
ncbi:hypothetical protein SKAU_G00093110 [Synaphobranchus kaupii]|uniref:Uncharacterized protein n=1 Tax=Synaphobranchus kaupii TaxID=118154 RepID=A0A9Q1FXX0_SYNKA|nr:hypothetical protein SKAU_G00093110 [Synaphobranchus kaupii]